MLPGLNLKFFAAFGSGEAVCLFRLGQDPDDRIHIYQLPSDDSFAHLEVQFRFNKLPSDVDGVPGKTYRPDFENPAKPGVPMPVVGGEDKYRTESMPSARCESWLFSQENSGTEKEAVTEYTTLNCTKFSYGLGIVCKK
ncbi:hypothetical protein K1719_027190 [Acacia pycnantha]|nr:hypothetical protein K1719_027190 [Acacia pycnantha]